MHAKVELLVGWPTTVTEALLVNAVPLVSPPVTATVERALNSADVVNVNVNVLPWSAEAKADGE